MKFPKQAADETGATSRNEVMSAEETLRQKNLVASLERGIKRRDAEIRKLTQAVDNEQRTSVALREAIDKAQARIEDLERGFEERMAQCRELRDALREERERAEAAEAKLTERDAAPAAGKSDEKVPTLQALMDDDSYMRETLAFDEDIDDFEEVATSTTTMSKTLPNLDSELVPADLIFPEDEDAPDNAEPVELSLADGDDSVIIKAPVIEAAQDDEQEQFNCTLAVVLSEDTTPIRHPIYKALMTIGRSRQADIQIASDYVSRVHAHIVTDDNGTYMEDAGSKNGVRVNDVRVEGRQPVVHNDVVRLGRIQFRVIDLNADD